MYVCIWFQAPPTLSRYKKYKLEAICGLPTYLLWSLETFISEQAKKTKKQNHGYFLFWHFWNWGQLKGKANLPWSISPLNLPPTNLWSGPAYFGNAAFNISPQTLVQPSSQPKLSPPTLLQSSGSTGQVFPIAYNKGTFQLNPQLVSFTLA